MSEQTTLREQLSAAFDAAESNEAPIEASAETAEAAAKTAEPATETAEPAAQTASEAAKTARDERGRFAKAEQAETAAAPEPAAPKAQRPSSWRKEMWEHWDRLDPAVQQYVQQRESEYSRGVSTYKTEYDRLRPLHDAVEPFLPLLQQHNIAPAQWLANLGNAHKTLVLGSPQEKAATFARLAQEYGVPLDGLAQIQPQQANQPPIAAPLWDRLQQIEQKFNGFLSAQERAEQERLNADITAFAAQNEHFEQVRETMSRLLETGVATDLKGAYDKAVRLHDDIWQAEQEKSRKAEEARKAEAARAAAAKARANAVSPRSANPTGALTGATDGKKDRRAALAEALDGALGGRL